MRRQSPPLSLNCPQCRGVLAVLDPPQEPGEPYSLWCPRCEHTFRAKPRPKLSVRPRTPRPPIGDLALYCRSRSLWVVLAVYRLGLGLGTVGLLVLGGFVPVCRAWLRDALNGWSSLITVLGGVSIQHGPVDPDADFGPILKRSEAPRLFSLLADLATQLEVRPPEQVRLAFLPCCGVVAWGRSRALLLGLPLLSVLEVAELRAVLAHELAHLARGDATWSARLVRSVEILDRALNDSDSTSWGPLRWWAIGCLRVANGLLGPIAEGQEARADRCSATVAGGRDAASALVKVALVQPLFRELLTITDIDDPNADNLYATFRRFWDRLPEPLVDAMRLKILTTTEAVDQSPHPPLADRVAQLLAYPDRRAIPLGGGPSLSLLGDPEWIEQMLHDHLYKLHPIEPTVFHPAGT